MSLHTHKLKRMGTPNSSSPTPVTVEWEALFKTTASPQVGSDVVYQVDQRLKSLTRWGQILHLNRVSSHVLSLRQKANVWTSPWWRVSYKRPALQLAEGAAREWQSQHALCVTDAHLESLHSSLMELRNELQQRMHDRRLRTGTHTVSTRLFSIG